MPVVYLDYGTSVSAVTVDDGYGGDGGGTTHGAPMPGGTVIDRDTYNTRRQQFADDAAAWLASARAAEEEAAADAAEQARAARPVPVLSGPVTDASFPHGRPPADGMMAVDATGRRLYVRVGGVWLSTALA